jgi:hypothetical protein
MQHCFLNEPRENKFGAPTLVTSSLWSSMSGLRQSPVLSKRTHRRCDMRVVAERNCHVALKANAGRLWLTVWVPLHQRLKG